MTHPCKPVDGLTHSYLKSILKYIPDRGVFVWIVARGKCRIGQEAGYDSHGRTFIHICNRFIQVSVLAWFYMTGEWPDREVDHKDKNKRNNIWDNLRLAEGYQNQANRRTYKNNTSGHQGIKRLPSGRFEAKLQVNKVRTVIGYYDTLEEAAAAYLLEKRRLLGEFA